MAKPASGGAGGSGGRGRAGSARRNYREYNGAESDALIRATWNSQNSSSRLALEDYQGGPWINSVLRENPELASTSRAIRHIAALDGSMRPLDEDTILHRGTVLPGINKIVNRLGMDGAIGQVINDKGYISTSYDRAVGDEFRKIYSGKNLALLRIRAPKGTKGAVASPDFEAYAYQREVVLARNTGLKIISIQKNAAGYYDIEAEAVQ